MTNREWLSQTVEPIVEPAMEICDPHHHLWHVPGNCYLLDEFFADINQGHNVVSTVFVECQSMYRVDGPEALRPVGEVEFANGIAAMSASGATGRTRIAAGIVGFADLTLGTDVEHVLREQMRAGGERFKGIRHATAWHPDASIHNAHTSPSEHLMQNRAFIKGLDVLGKLGLTFDAWVYHEQLPDFAELARNAPNTTIILDHFGGPLGVGPYTNQLDSVFNEWSESITNLAQCRNVFCKMGGINMKVNGYRWHKQAQPPSSDQLAETTQRYYHRAIEVFGAERCMFESNFPMDRESCSYAVLWNAFKKISASYSEEERKALLKDTAERCYSLK
ncbi:MAG: amidohydrolase family protein [Pseudomonadota bacterium]